MVQIYVLALGSEAVEVEGTPNELNQRLWFNYHQDISEDYSIIARLF